MRLGWANDGSEGGWTLVRSDHFEVYSEASGQSVRKTIEWLERLRAFFDQNGLRLKSGRVVRVIGFSSAKSYAAYRLSATSDAYYLGTDARDYIVIPIPDASESTVAAHEYAHAQLRASGVKLPLWLNEGLADLFSTVRIFNTDCYLGGPLAGRLQVLRHTPWMSLRDLLAVKSDSNIKVNRAYAAVFYAQSWALAQMLALSTQYSAGFHELIAKLDSGVPSAGALESVYGKSLDQIAMDLRQSIDHQRFERIRMTIAPEPEPPLEERKLSSSESDAALADLLTAMGQIDRAESLYRQIAISEPRNAEVRAALGSIALRKGDAVLARTEWKRAIEYGIADAKVCFQYAELADDAGVASDETRSVLERAIALDPGFDNARFKLALLESNAGDYPAAIRELKAMREVAPARAFGYWSVMSYALNELDQREDAKQAANNALEFANTPDEREQAMRLAYTAQTDFAVQFAHDANGHLQFVTTRVPHGTTDRNPFIEPGDRIERAEGQLKTISCAGGKATGVLVETITGTLQLSIADPARIQMRNAPESFTCGDQSARTVIVNYAASNAREQGIVRGMEFR